MPSRCCVQISAIRYEKRIGPESALKLKSIGTDMAAVVAAIPIYAAPVFYFWTRNETKRNHHVTAGYAYG
jgi:hypothetical protein